MDVDDIADESILRSRVFKGNNDDCLVDARLVRRCDNISPLNSRKYPEGKKLLAD
jgi:hypothetical protein